MTPWKFAALAMAATVVGAYDGSADASRASRGRPSRLRPAASDSTAVLLAAGDIAACTRGAHATALLLDDLPGEIVVAGDAAYYSARDRDPYRTCYDSTWGRHKQRTHPAIGNHDAEVRMARKYFEYFGAAAGPQPGGYYSFAVGAWHVLALNSMIAMDPRSAQGRWIAADLAANPAKCTLAFLHHPQFSSGPHAKRWTTRSVFPLLDSAGVDVLISAHDHIYERFAPMRANGTRDEDGVRQFVVGTGGNGLYAIERVQRNSEALSDEEYGVLKLTLEPERYAWEFVPVNHGTFSDSGSARCR